MRDEGRGTAGLFGELSWLSTRATLDVAPQNHRSFLGSFETRLVCAQDQAFVIGCQANAPSYPAIPSSDSNWQSRRRASSLLGDFELVPSST
jgi:hypothetical protein